MKILEITPYFYPSFVYGGPPRIVYEVCKRLANKGHEVTIYTTDAYGKNKRVDFPQKTPVMIDDIRVYYLKNLANFLFSNFNIFLTPQIVPLLRKNIKNFDVIHLTEYYTFQNVVASYYAKKFNVPYVVSAHGSAIPVSQAGKVFLKKAFIQFFGRRILKMASLVIALTEEERRQYVQEGVAKEKIAIIPNGVDLKEFLNLSPKEKLKKRHKIKSSDLVILFLGRIHPKKGVDILVDAFSNLARQKDSPVLVVAGSEEDKAYTHSIKQKIITDGLEDKVLFTGFLSTDERREALSSADIFVLPSHSEGLPIAILEACASGTPVIITKQCNLPEVEEYKCGVVINPKVGELKSALELLLKNKRLRIQMGRRGKKMIREKFDWDKIVSRLEGLFREIK